ncbi:leucine--tRNA ligase [Myxacorys almedinensis]|uniref:Leucine--tRNA ligase n=1 Tax=Myxacorys almedinensis A TaxID=2690445 RepID=A0A8J7YY49_9CYAN|nr:leucine--tRNA ligase [Myxacorys almedinensis A]
MESRYNPANIEAQWQHTWAAHQLYKTPEESSKPKFYALSMFPYPSGNLHMGHVRVYTIVDVMARLKRMQGYRVLNPMGWDAFGLPAENAAIERNTQPAKWTYQNIDQMRDQLKQLGISFDWDREIATCSPEYYRWTQWIFLEFFKAGLAYQKEATVNWDPIDQTVLANEQVDAEGKSWRSGAIVERKLLRQWFLKITDYADQLLDDLNKLTGWPERVKLMQANWIGKSVGAYLEFPIVGMDEKVGVFTTRPDTVYGVSYLVLAPEHPLTQKVTTSDPSEPDGASRISAVEAFVQEVSTQTELERTAEDKPKRGIPTGGTAINPFTGEEIPIWIADYVLYEYGTGAVMGVPAHDVRDFQFAKQQNLPIKVVIMPPDQPTVSDLQAAYTDVGTIVNSGEFDGMVSTEAKGAIVAYAEKQGWGKARIQYRLRDWLISRQRYWGAPIPIIHCPNCGAVPVPESDLPVRLPEDVELSGRGGSPLGKLESWLNVPCPSCGTPAKRETDTMDTFIDSSWYFLRYPDANNDQAIFDRGKTNNWMPVDQYVGGIEHAILHLLYSRFFTKVLRDCNLLAFDEPFKRLLTQGMVQGRTYKNPTTGKYVLPTQIKDPANPIDPDTGETLEVVFEKMSKSKHNGVAPGDVIDKYGADTARMFILFKAPPEKDLEWEDADVEGQFRFLNRVWRLVTESAAFLKTTESQDLTKSEKELRRVIHTAIKEVTEDLQGDYQFNTAVSELMKLSNALGDFAEKSSPVFAEGLNTLLLLLAPFSPHITEELWRTIGQSESIHTQAFPTVDPTALVADEKTIVIQIMGKTRGTIEAATAIADDKTALEKFATESEVARRYINGKEIRKIIVVPGKLVNFVTA